MEFQMLICSILFFSLSIMLKFYKVFFCERALANINCFFKRRISILLINWLFCTEFIAFTFFFLPLWPFVFCLSLICKYSSNKLYNYYVDQSELLARFQTDFTWSVWNFFCWCVDGCICRLHFKQLYAWTIKLEVTTMHWFLSVFICI